MRLQGFLLSALLLAPAPAGAQEAAVLAKGSGPYFEAYLSLQKSLGRPVPPFDLSEGAPKLPGGLKAVVTFGARAANLGYHKDTRVIFALAPGYNPPKGSDRYTRVCPLPAPDAALRVFSGLQPGLKRLAVIYSGDISGYAARLAEITAPGAEIIRVRLDSAKELPGRLRELSGKADAVWLLPAPALINRTSLSVLAEFSCSAKIPFYVPSAGLVGFGAAGAYAPTPESSGRAAAKALKSAMDGKDPPPVIHPEAELTLNREAVLRCGLQLNLPPGNGR